MARALELVETRPTGHGRARGLVSDRASGRRVEARTFAPSGELAGVVAAHWAGSWDLRGQPPHESELIADPCVNFVFEEGGAHAGSRVVGVWTRLWRRRLEGKGRVRAAKLRAGAVTAFVEVAAHVLVDRIVPLASLCGPTGDLERAVLGPRDHREAFEALEAWLLARVRPDVDGHRALAIALVDRVAADPSITTVERLAEVAGLAPRVLQRLFRAHVGATPKWVIRKNRLQEVALRIERGDSPTIASLAAALGYADQAHLAHDFKSVVGKSPRDFARSLRG